MSIAQQQLQTLSQQVMQLVQISRAIDSRHTSKINYKLRDKYLFYPGLFQTKGVQLNAYFDELTQTLAKLTLRLDKKVNVEEDLLAASLVEKVAHQYRALQAVLNACHLSVHKQTPPAHQIAEPNAIYAVTEKHNNLDVSPNTGVLGKVKKVLNKSHYLYGKLAQQQEYERRLEAMIISQQDPAQIEITKQRLIRCQAATKKVRLQLQRYEQKQDN